jgi:hypothetical protein
VPANGIPPGLPLKISPEIRHIYDLHKRNFDGGLKVHGDLRGFEIADFTDHDDEGSRLTPRANRRRRSRPREGRR